MNSSDISLYFHIPFCTHKCPYCHFYVTADKSHLKERLLLGLQQEWQRITPLLTGKNLISIYFGGGTPALFEPERIKTVLDMVKTQFSSIDNVEITLEANPETLSYSQMQGFQKAGVNRVSLGVQSFHQKELDILGRKHSSQKSREAIFSVKEAGIHNISIDLMYELPSQTMALWQETLYQASQLPITHLSLYNLTIEPYTPFSRKEHLLRPLLPNPETGARMYTQAISMLGEHGLTQYEISAFCKENFESRHNTGYWTGRHFFGLGPSAFSYFGFKRFRNIASLSRYCTLLEQGLSPVDFEEEENSSSRRRELFALHLRLRKGVRITDFEERFGSLEEETLSTITSLEKAGLVLRNATDIALSHRGVLFYDTVASELI